MSFLYRTVPAIRIAARPSTRCFSTTLIQQKVVPDAVAEPLKKVDRAVSDTIVAGIDKGVEVKDAVAGSAAKNAEEAKGTVAGKAEELKGDAKGAAAKAEGKVKGAAEEAKAKM